MPTELELLQKMHSLTEPGELAGGAVVAGNVYRKFVIGLDDGNLAAKIEGLNLLTDIEKLAANFAERIQFEGLPKGALSYKALIDLKGPDWNQIMNAANRLADAYSSFRGRTEGKAGNGNSDRA
jgi:hypothetical protein